MEDKKNVTICFNSDEMYIYNHFKDIGGKTSSEMKRVLKDFVDNNGQSNDLNGTVDERVAKILSVILGNGMPTIGGMSISPEMFSQLNNLQAQQNTLSNESSEKDEENEEDMFDLPPDNFMDNFPMMNICLDDDDDE